MNCTYFRTLGSAIIDNEASDAEINEFNQHIATCDECKTWFETIKILKSESVALEEDAPPQLKERVMLSARNLNKKPSLFSRFRFTAVAAAVAIIIFAANGFMGGDTPAGENAPTVVNELPAGAGRMAPTPGEIGAGVKTETPEVPYNRNFSYVVYITDPEINSLLSDKKYEEIGGYKYYITDIKYDEIASFTQEIIAFNTSLDTEGLIIIKE